MEDLIRRSDAVAILEDLQKDHLQFCLIPFRQAIERVQAIPSAESTGDLDNAIYEYVQDGLMSNPYDRPQGEWIPCSERLPEYGVPVLTWDGSMWTVEQRIPFILDDDFNRIYSEWWVDGYFDEDCEDAEYYPNLREGAAVAWMPLPEPWEGVDDGKDIQSEVE